MSNELRTRRLIVTLPDTAEEEVDEIATETEEWLRKWIGMDRPAVVDVALDAAPMPNHDVDGVAVYAAPPRGLLVTEPMVAIRGPYEEKATWFESPANARKLAALILRAADEAEGRA